MYHEMQTLDLLSQNKIPYCVVSLVLLPYPVHKSLWSISAHHFCSMANHFVCMPTPNAPWHVHLPMRSIKAIKRLVSIISGAYMVLQCSPWFCICSQGSKMMTPR